MAATKLIIDADPGIGDALAVTAALLDPGIDLIGLTGVPGRFSGEEATQNLQSILALLDPPKWPRLGRGEGPSPVTYESGYPHPKLLHGESGLGDFAGYNAEPVDRMDADKLLAELVRENPGEVTLLTLGPLTNVQLAQRLHPTFFEELNQIVVLGGAVSCGGDVTPAADLNFYADPQAAREVLSTRCTSTLVPMDVCRDVTLTFDQLDRLGVDKNTRVGRLLDMLLPFFFRSHHEQLGVESIGLDALVALSLVVRPRLFETERMSVDIETAGELTRGMAVVDRRAGHSVPNLDVATHVDADGVRNYLATLLM